MNLYSVASAGYIAQRYMAENGLFVVMGATAALGPTPGMMGYGLSKAAAHHYVQTLGATSGLGVVPKSQRKESRQLRGDNKYLDTLTVVGILPTTIDTPSNRAAMPKADFAHWTKPSDIAQEIGNWVQTPALRPHSGSLVKVQTGPDGSQFHLVR
jgi:dihydropteridine reductase